MAYNFRLTSVSMINRFFLPKIIFTFLLIQLFKVILNVTPLRMPPLMSPPMCQFLLYGTPTYSTLQIYHVILHTFYNMAIYVATLPLLLDFLREKYP